LVDKVVTLAREQNAIAARAEERVREIATRLEALNVRAVPPLLELPEFPANMPSLDALKQMAELLSAPLKPR
jgi:hypothetical protein